MNLSFSLIRGLSLGIEYVDLDEDDQAAMATDGNLMVIISLAFIRLVYLNGGVSDE